MARTRRAWSTIRDTDIRPILRETTAATSYWGDPELLLYANLSIDRRAIEMMDKGEGFFVDRHRADLVANQAEYLLPEGYDRIKRVLIQRTEGNSVLEYPLVRDEKLGTAVHHSSSGINSEGYCPTYRLQGDLIYLEPRPTFSRTNGLVFEMQNAPTRLTGDASELDADFPALMETMLVLDVVELAWAVEDSQGNVAPEARGRMAYVHRAYEKHWERLIRARSHGRVFAQRLALGD